MIDLYKNIKRLRLENNWSQGELAKRAGYKDRSAIAHIEDGKIDLPQSKIRLFAEIFGTTPAALFGDDGCSSNNPRSEFDQKLISAYHSHTVKERGLVCQLLDIEDPSLEEDAKSSDLGNEKGA